MSITVETARPSWRRREVAAIATLAWPIIIGKLSLMGQNTIDVMLAGHLSAHVLGAVAMGAAMWWLALLAQAGLTLAVSPIVSEMDGAGRRGEVGPVFVQSLWIASGLGVVLSVTVYLAMPGLIGLMGVDPGLLADARAFLRAIAWAAPAVGLLFACMGLSEGLSMPSHGMAAGLLGLALLGPLGYVVMYGRLGLPAYGAAGSGIANCVVVWTQALAFLAWIRWSGRYRGLGWPRSWAPRWPMIRTLLATGIPIAVSQLLESGLFTTAGLLVGRFGAAAAASHLVSLNTGALVFMVPLGLAFATTVRVGNALGRGDPVGLRRSGLTGMAMAVAVQSVACAVMLSVPHHIARLYSNDPEVVARAGALLRLAGLFAFADGLQVAAIAALRGIKDTRVPMLITAVAYWGVGLPVALFCAFTLRLEARGVWMGLIAALVVVAGLLTARFLQRSRPASPRPTRSGLA